MADRTSRFVTPWDRSAIIPGRSLTRSKAPGKMFDIVRGPLFGAYGDGAEIVDFDGHHYIDMICALGAISLGYTHEQDVNPILSLPSFMEGSAAHTVLETIAPWASHVRFVKTGSEATHAAYRIAKRATGRPFVLMGDWAYHGWHEWCERRPDGVMESFHTLLYSHGASFVDTLGHGVHPLNVDPEEVAAIFLEPHRWVPVSLDWLSSVRDFCTQHGILLVFDEMIYGGRWARGGATEYFGVTPDLACFGKAIGNGYAVACVVGREALAQHGEIVSGTYSGDIVGLSAVIDTLDVYRQQPVVEMLWTRGRQLQVGLDALVSGRTDVVREGVPVHQRLRWTDPALARHFGAEMARRGVLWHPDVVNVMAAHTEDQIAQVIEAAAASLAALA